MMAKIGIVAVFLVGAVMAIWAKMSNNRYRTEQTAAMDSPMTEAIAQLLGIAGGIYLSLVMAMSFLGMEQPALITVGEMMMDPLALVSIILAFIQPIVLHWLRSRF